MLTLTALDAGASLVVIDAAEGLVRYAELNDPKYKPNPHREFKSELNHVKAACKRTNGIVMFLSRPRTNAPGLRGTGISEKAHQKVHLKVIELKQSGRRRVVTTNGADFWIDPGTGIDRREDLLRTGLEMDLVTINGSWWFLEGDYIHKFLGIESAKEYLYLHPEVARELESSIMIEATQRYTR